MDNWKSTSKSQAWSMRRPWVEARPWAFIGRAFTHAPCYAPIRRKARLSMA